MSNIILPKNESRNIKTIILKNGIKCILIEDIYLDKSYVISSVNIGSLANKNYYDGLAHLLEHMIFISSKKYKEQNYLQKKITEAGGSTNAFTELFQTTYYLDVFNEHLENILKIFIDFFTNSMLNEEYIKKELHNVDAEHQKNILNDEWKLHDFKHFISNSNSNYNTFQTGTINTLNKSDIKNKLVEFYNKYYVSNNISICIASNKSIKELTKIVTKYFSIIKNHPKNTVELIKPIYSQGKTYYIKANNNTILFNYLFETSINIKLYYVIAFFFNFTDKYSLSNFLKNKGYIEYIASDYDENVGIFNIRISLTNLGLDNINYIDGYIKYTIKYIYSLKLNKLVDYYKKKLYFLFNYSEKKDTLDLAIDLVSKSHNHDLKYIYVDNYILNNKKIDILNFDNCIQILQLKDYPIKKLLKEQNYETLYSEIERINNKPIKYNYSINLKNPFLNIKPKHINDLNNIIPSLIDSNIWFGNTSKFNENNIYISIIYYKDYFNTPTNIVLSNLSVLILNYYIEKELGDINYTVSFDSNQNLNQICLNLYLYNDITKIQLFIDTVLNIINSKINISDKVIESFIVLLEKKLLNILNLNAWEFCNYIINSCYENFFNYKILLKELKQIKIKTIKKYLNNLLNLSSQTIFIYGNIAKNNIPKFNIKSSDISINKINIKFNKLIEIKHTDKNNCIKILYHVGSFNPLLNLYLFLIEIITSDLFYTELRTKQMVGYLVRMNIGNINNNYYIFQQIQSELSNNELEKRINKFNKALKKDIINIDFNKWKKTLKLHLEQNENNTLELFSKYYNEIANKTYLFNRKELLLKHFENITFNGFIEFCNKYLFDNENKTIIKINKI